MSWTFSRDIQGIHVRVEGDEPALLNWLEFDFDSFPIGKLLDPDVSLQVKIEAYTPPSGLLESFRGPYGVCFDNGNIRHIWYPGPVWVCFDFDKDKVRVIGENPVQTYERLYLSLLSRLGEKLEGKGLHRIHGLALDSPWGSCLFLMRAGVGKSDLAYNLLQRPGWKLISEDTPLLDRHGRLLPFPFRLGLRRGGLGSPKTLLRASDFPVETGAHRCRHVFAGAWTTSADPSSGELSRDRLFWLLLRDGVVGVGVPQVAELFMRPSRHELFHKTCLALARLRSVLPLLLANRQTLYLTPDGDRNARYLEECLKRGSEWAGEPEPHEECGAS